MRRKCRSLRMIEWSRHSRLTLLIRRSTYGFCHGRRDDLFHAHRRHGRAERLPVCAVPVADQVPRRRAPRECLPDLLCDPRHRRVRRDSEMHDLAALVGEHDEPEQEVERGRGDHEEIDRRQAIGVICKECPPRLRWRRWVTDHVFRDGGLGDGKAKLQKLAMDPRCAPPCVLPRHPSDQIADLPRHLSLLLTRLGAETLVFWVPQPLAWLVAPKNVTLMTRRGDLKLSHGATAKARENTVKQDRVQTTNAIKSPGKAWISAPGGVYRRDNIVLRPYKG